MLLSAILLLSLTLTVMADNAIPRVFHGRWIEIQEGMADSEHPPCDDLIEAEKIVIDQHTYKDAEYDCVFEKVILNEGYGNGVLVNVEQQCKKNGKDVGKRLNIFNVIAGQPGNVLILVPPEGGFRYYRRC